MARTLEQVVTSLKGEKKEEQENQSWSWYLRKARELRQQATTQKDITPADIFKDGKIPKLTKIPTQIKGAGSIIGKLILFKYDPKGKLKLPYYDVYPMGFPIEIYHDGYLMLNLHYLPPQLRARLMDNLYSFMANKDKGITEQSQLILSYKLLKETARANMFKPCVKRYLATNVKSKWNMISPLEWDVAAMLPLQQFRKASSTEVWQDSVRLINKKPTNP